MQRPAKATKPRGDVQIKGVTYFLLTAVAEELEISRQTLWRWRTEGKIPQGHRYRGRKVVFTASEVQTIREYANRVEPIKPGNGRQLRLFNGDSE